MQGKVELCGVNTSQLPVIPQAQMENLLLLAKGGDEKARQMLIEGNLRLVLSVIQRFDKRGENPDDLFQVGCIGLMKAIQNFDPTKQVKFSTYGVPMIAGEIRRYLRDNAPIRVSRSIRDVAGQRIFIQPLNIVYKAGLLQVLRQNLAHSGGSRRNMLKGGSAKTAV